MWWTIELSPYSIKLHLVPPRRIQCAMQNYRLSTPIGVKVSLSRNKLRLTQSG